MLLNVGGDFGVALCAANGAQRTSLAPGWSWRRLGQSRALPSFTAPSLRKRIRIEIPALVIHARGRLAEDRRDLGLGPLFSFEFLQAPLRAVGFAVPPWRNWSFRVVRASSIADFGFTPAGRG